MKTTQPTSRPTFGRIQIEVNETRLTSTVKPRFDGDGGKDGKDG